MSIIMWMKLLPTIIQATIMLVKALEDVIPADGWGSDKLAALDDILKDVIDASEDIDIDYGIIRPRVHKIASVVVALMNKVSKGD